MKTQRILLVEDDVWLKELYSDAIQKDESTQLVLGSSAEEALDAIDSQKIDLIVLDMFLPEHNGIELLHEIASYEDISRIPVIILSAVHERDFALKKERWHHYGIKRYLYKPAYKPDEIAEVIHEILAESVSV